MKIQNENAVLFFKQQNINELQEKKNKVEKFIHFFERETNRLPTTSEIIDNMEDNIPLDIICLVLSEVESINILSSSMV